ncbi:MAG: hypothetical protein HY268_11585 [Deltaproteobacteria bacterium]|nr:hypothetical protein [Deltaproteobacteria bacterium]
MALTIEITPELESQVREQAEQRGLGAGEYVVNILREHLRQTHTIDARCLPEAEARLLQQINEGLSPEMWQRYNELIAKRRAETLTPDEHAALIALSDQIEDLNARRVECLAELARLRQTSLSALMQQLGIKAPPYV